MARLSKVELLSTPDFLLSAEDVERRNLHIEFDKRELAQISLAGYAAWVLDVKPATHHMVICEAIDDLMSDEYDELIILAPPGSAKSTYTSVAFAAYFLGRWPTRHILTASYSSELAEKWGRKVRGIVDSSPHQSIFEDSVLSKVSAAAGRWSTTVGGEFYAAGVGGRILGFRADLGLIDDPVSGFEQAQSITQLTKMHEWYENDFITRLKPNAKVVLICQRLARNDMAGYLIDRNKIAQTRRQRVLTIPMIAGEDDPIGRAPGEQLWPEWYTPEMVVDAQRDDYKWRTLYQQQPPADDGAWVGGKDIQIVDEVPDGGGYYVLTDLALSVNSGDYSVHLTVKVTDAKDIYIIEGWRERVSIEQTVEKHLDLCETYGPQLSLIDDDNAAKVYVQLLSQMARASKTNVPWKMLPMRGQDKETRAAPLRGWFKRGKIFIKRGEFNRWLVKELLTFPNAMGQGVDDGVDALGLIGRRLGSLSRAPSAIPEGPPPDPRGTFFSATFDQLWETLPNKHRRI